MKFLSFILMFLLIGAFFIVSDNNLALKEQENREKFYEHYTNWIGKLFENSKSTVGYVVKMNWLPEENKE